ncbi:MAG: PKD domain-containing protein [archaeon]
MRKIFSIFIIFILTTISVSALVAIIETPADGTGWATNENVFFRGNYTAGLPGASYTWDFGSPAVNLRFSSQINLQNPVVQYTANRTYNVLLTVDDGAEIDTDSININAIIPPPIGNFSCQLRLGNCIANEIEMIRLSHLTNAHARGFEDSNKVLYPYAVCCNTDLTAKVYQAPPGGAVYAVLQNDSSTVVEGGHKSEVDVNLKYYQVGNLGGSGAQCEVITSGSCNAECIYEFYPNDVLPGGSHVANCSGNYANKECCALSEDCTNDIDDDIDVYTDCGDTECHATMQPCGVSTTEDTYSGTDYYCSKGELEFIDPLPAYAPDINDARHCCPAGSYWDPATLDCEVAEQCYGEVTSACQKDYTSDFDNWLTDSVVFGGPDNTDCFISQPTYDEQACCPIHIYGGDTYSYYPVEYYIVN